MPNYRYRALNANGDLISGAIAAPAPGDVGPRIERLGLVLVDNVTPDEGGAAGGFFNLFNKPKPEDVTIFTRDLALLLRAGARINDGLELLAADPDFGRLRSVVADIRSRVVSGESFAEALARHEGLFPPMYIALVRVGEASGSLDQVLEVLAGERARGEALRRRLSDAIRYPLFVLGAAGCVLLFFLSFVLPQFASVLQDFGAKVDPVVGVFLNISTFLRSNSDTVLAGLAVIIAATWLMLRQQRIRHGITNAIVRLPAIRNIMSAYRTALFCRNLGLLLGSGVNLTTTLRILIDMMATTGPSAVWSDAADRVRHGSKLSDALAETEALPAMAVRMLRLGDETGQLPMLSGRVAEFYETKLQRTLDRAVGVAGPAAIIAISLVVGGLITSVMTALMSVSQIVG
ncbi:type II secretion system F family protein [Bradyrhizobium diazoefficiens]|uniref:type II secretion system F family protein n=1 Tax=Bradyrhizobium diazoefficiens TaxID=1355477 RepID=UPI00190C80B2|nr:type II secretion system F family protein [Bradyrhizobium diazoefficiens]QQO17089.1 type II secretion system F family protein [Bradyrhizobium diazoefficiens]